MKVAIYSTHQFDQPYLIAANKQQHELVFIKEPLMHNTISLCKGCDAIALFSSDWVDKKTILQLVKQGIKYISLRSVGYNHVDLKKAKEFGLRVANVPAYSPYSIAEHAISLMMALNRKLILADQQVKAFNFCIDNLVGFDMNGKTVGIVGVGKIGKVLVKILHGFGCKVLGFDLEHDAELSKQYSLTYCSLEELCKQSDIISLSLPLTPKTKYMIGKQELAIMKNDVMLVNTGRGKLIDTQELLSALESKKIGALGLDVYEHENGLFFEDHSNQPFLEDKMISRLMSFKNVLITSHQAFLTQTALRNIADSTFFNLNCFEQEIECKNELTKA